MVGDIVEVLPRGKIFALAVYERARHLCVQYANSFAQSANGALIPYLVKKEKVAARTTARAVLLFLVEVWRYSPLAKISTYSA